jgi:hypothetical protein
MKREGWLGSAAAAAAAAVLRQFAGDAAATVWLHGQLVGKLHARAAGSACIALHLVLARPAALQDQLSLQVLARCFWGTVVTTVMKGLLVVALSSNTGTFNCK